MKNMLFVAIVGLFLAGSLAGCATHQKTMEEQAEEAREKAYSEETYDSRTDEEKMLDFVDRWVFILSP